jgi:hypothetical protein
MLAWICPEDFVEHPKMVPTKIQEEKGGTDEYHSRIEKKTSISPSTKLQVG